MPSIITLTINPTIDKSTSVNSVASEIKLRCAPPQFHPGGGGINVSRAIKRLGGSSRAVYTAGGGSGQMLTSLLQAEGIDTNPVTISGLTRENLTVFEESTTLQYRFGMPGPELSQAEEEACIEAIFSQPADYVVASGSLTPQMEDTFYTELAERAKRVGSKIIVDTSGKALAACAKAGVFLMKPNIDEIEALSGEKFQSEEKLIEITQRLIREGMAEVFVISMGAAGALTVMKDKSLKMRPPVVPIKSKVGAGDSMVGGIVWALSEGKELFDAVRYGISAGSATVMTAGTELCRREDVMMIYPRVAVVE